jgi:hypothetical protein
MVVAQSVCSPERPARPRCERGTTAPDGGLVWSTASAALARCPRAQPGHLTLPPCRCRGAPAAAAANHLPLSRCATRARATPRRMWWWLSRSFPAATTSSSSQRPSSAGTPPLCRRCAVCCARVPAQLLVVASCACGCSVLCLHPLCAPALLTCCPLPPPRWRDAPRRCKTRG